MRRLFLTLATATGLALGAGAVQAEPPGYGEAVYAPNFGYQINNFYGRPGVGPCYRVFESHDEAVRRIKAAHSRYRYYTHPRSMYNSPPTQADYFGWDWGN